MSKKHLSIRIEEEMLSKFREIAKQKKHSANKQILALIRVCIEQFEAKHGPIKEQ